MGSNVVKCANCDGLMREINPFSMECEECGETLDINETDDDE